MFVAALGASSYTWAEAARDQQMEDWLADTKTAINRIFKALPQIDQIDIIVRDPASYDKELHTRKQQLDRVIAVLEAIEVGSDKPMSTPKSKGTAGGADD